MYSLIGATSRLILLVSLFLLSATGNVDADNLEAQKKALEVIETFADRLCTTVPLSGSTNNVELSGNAKAELNALIKQIANLGIQGAAKYQNTEWQGILQQDLAGQLSQSRNCKLEVFKTLQSKLLSKAEPQKLQNEYIIQIESAHIIDRADGMTCNIVFSLTAQCNAQNNCYIHSGDLSNLCKEFDNRVMFFPDRIISITYKCLSLLSGLEFLKTYERKYDQGISISCL